MGTVYCGPYADAIGYDDHEGYAARILPDGTETGTWTYETREFLGYRAHCACGWRSTATHPATDAGEDAALNDDWDHDHLRPLIQEEARRHVITADLLLDVIHQLRTSATRGVDALTEHGRGVLDAAELVERLVPTSHGRRQADDRPNSSRQQGSGAAERSARRADHVRRAPIAAGR